MMKEEEPKIALSLKEFEEITQNIETKMREFAENEVSERIQHEVEKRLVESAKKSFASSYEKLANAYEKLTEYLKELLESQKDLEKRISQFLKIAKLSNEESKLLRQAIQKALGEADAKGDKFRV